MRISACITTRNRTESLDACLAALLDCHTKPHSVVVSDDSSEPEIQQKNYEVTQKYPQTIYVKGPRTGVCANRNNAVNTIPPAETDFVAFIDDDICVDPNFMDIAIQQYSQISLEERDNTILSGVSRTPDGKNEMLPGKLSFRGYFCSAEVPETVAIHAALFPRHFLEQEQWDENIFFGYEDAELCLRALKRGYKIVHCPELRVIHAGAGNNSSLQVPDVGGLTNYEICVEAARLYIGIKRYKDLFPNFGKLITFIGLYFVQMTAYLIKRGSIQAWPKIIRRSHIQRLWQSYSV